HVGPVLADGRKEDQAAVLEERIDQRDVVEVRPASIRIVEEDHVARREVVTELRHRGLDGPRQRHHVGADVLGLRHDLRGGVEEPAREVLRLVDRHRPRGPEHRGAHLAHDRDQALRHHLERDGVDHRSASRTRLPWASCRAPKPGGTTVVVPGSSTSAGPRTIAAAGNRSRAYTGVGTNMPSNATSRSPMGTASGPPTPAPARGSWGFATTPYAESRNETISTGASTASECRAWCARRNARSTSPMEPMSWPNGTDSSKAWPT